ncbi:2Fe-2S iron-sulfur cluster-binding protein [Caballeronia sp. LZ001]|uniref:2Fe-2S iron-sulfur cluster-binding protein n=1 Tax=Caballeronia sp. LZ001 TaxID=3038553 RepID=UPI00285601DD|nr:2Fe-2S iron-sulfur cluster-binding protein [Caballeronia sp. LZ001]MDR5804845.1 2Fe-2S iron-sulfur cluster-binding protein [Caballeronia sp. LZ001]
MLILTIIEYSGREHRLSCSPGETVMQVAVANGVSGILGDCGGSCACATCHAYVDPVWLDRVPAPDASERDMLECAVDSDESSRLTCQIAMTDALDGLIVRLPRSQT